jgi:hypothetical protein
MLRPTGQMAFGSRDTGRDPSLVSLHISEHAVVMLHIISITATRNMYLCYVLLKCF